MTDQPAAAAPVPSAPAPTELHGPVYGLVYGDSNTVTIVNQARPAPAPFLAPPLPPHRLVGREELVGALTAALVGPGPRLVALHGLPGVGKTTLATVLAHDQGLLARYPDGVLWAGAGREPRSSERLAAWAAAVGVERTAFSRLTSLEQMAAAVHAVIGTRRMLVLVDDVWTVGAGLLFKLGGPGCAHVFTTRLPEIAVRLAGRGSVRVPELDRRDGLELLRQLAPSLAPADENADDTDANDTDDEVAALVDQVGGLPLALTLMGRHIDVQALGGQRRRVARAVRQLAQAQARFELTEEQGPLDRHPSLSPGSSLSLLAAIEVSNGWLSPAAQAALRSLGAFAPKPNTFSLEAATAVTGAAESALDELLHAGLLEAGGDDRYALHQTIVDFARSSGTDPAARRRMVEHYTAAFPPAEAGGEPGSIGAAELSRFDAEAGNVAAALDHAPDDGKAYLALLDAVYPYLEARGLYRSLTTYLERATAIAARVGNPPARARVLYRLGYILYEQGQLQQAERWLTEAHALVGATDRGMDAVDVATKLGWVLAMQGRVDDGEAHFAAALRLATSADLPARSARAMHGLAWLLRLRNEHEQAREQLRQSLALARTSGDTALVTGSLEMLGWTTAIGGHYEEAEAAFAECVTLARQVGRQGALIIALHGLGWLRLMRGRFEEAVPYLREGLAIATATGHYERGSLLINLGWAERESGRYPQAEAAMLEGLAISRAEGRLEKVSQALKELGQLARQRGDLAGAERYLAESLTTARRMGLGDSTVGALHVLGLVELQRGRTAEARTYLDEAAAMERDRGNPDMVARLLRDLGHVEAAAGHVDAALSRFREAHRIATVAGNADTAGSALHEAARILLGTGERAAARAAAEAALAGLRAAGDRQADEVAAWLAQLDADTRPGKPATS